MARLSHKRVMEIKLIIAKSALRQIRDTAKGMVSEMEAKQTTGASVQASDVRNMVVQFSNLAYFTLSDLETPDEQIKGIGHG